jgi:YVTN family beta-propeller protein
MLRKTLLLSLILFLTVSVFGQITVVDTIFLRPRAGNGHLPTAVGVNSQTNRIYVSNHDSDNVSVIDGAGDSVIATIGVGDEPWGVGVNSQTNRIYVSNWFSDNVSVINGSGDSVIATIGVGDRPEGVGVNPQTNRIYVGCYYNGTFWVLHDEGAGAEEFILNPDILSLNITPNPFNRTTCFVLNIPDNSRGKSIEFSIYNLSGRLVKKFSHISNTSCPVIISWDGKADSGKDLSSGLYFGVLKCGNDEIQKKMIMIR